MSTLPVTRNSKGLVDTLFDTIDRLNRKEIPAEHARAVAHTARAIVGIATLELEARKFARDAEPDGMKLISLDIEAANPAG